MKINKKKIGGNIKNSLKEMSKLNKKTLKNGSYSIAATVILLVVVIVINLIVAQIPEKYTQIDVSEQKLYTISEKTEDFLDELEQDVTIYHIVQNGYEDDSIVKLLNKFEEESKHIIVETKDPVLYPNFVSQYTDESIYDNSLIVVSGERSKYISYYDLYEMEYDYYYGSSTTTGFDGEGQIDSAISYVISEDLPVLYFTEGHGELEPDSTTTASLEKANYQLETINLITAEEVPEDAGCLIVCSPQSDISENEAEKMITYLENGGKAMFVMDYIGKELPNFQSVFENYGITQEVGIVMEGDAQHYIMQAPYYIIPNIESTDITTDLISDNKYVLLPATQPVGVLESYRDTLEIEAILTTSERAYLKEDVENMETFEQEDVDKSGEFNVAVLITEDVSDDEQTQIVYYGSSAIVDSTTDQYVSGGNSELLLASLGWMCEVEVPVVDVASKSLSITYLTVPEYDAGYWASMVCGVIPAFFLIFGGIIWFKRRKQ